MPRFLLVRLGSLGDIVHGLPVAAALREAFPDARIDWLVDERHAEILELVPVIDRRIVVGASARGFIEAMRTLRRHAYDVALDLQGLWKSAALARGSGASRVIGFPGAHLREPGARWFYSETCAVSGSHVIEKNLSLLTPLGLESKHRAVRFPLTLPEPLASSPTLHQVYQRLDLAAGDRFALLNPGAAWPNKRWPPERYGHLAAGIARRHGMRSAVLWGPGEESLATQVAEASQGRAVEAPRTRILDVLQLARAAGLMVSGDTGPLHLAAAMGTPVVGLFGPTDTERNGPWGATETSLSRYSSCECHYRRRCRRSTPCLLELDPNEVMDVIDRCLASGVADRSEDRPQRRTIGGGGSSAPPDSL